ncbi:hypothetical protein CFC21_104348 [Triticum aestivum]|uniref:Protein kinase domain-containing protein n=2 Tax=Triticum aestivum TaxID=4565 RepID=A0A9R1M9W5_WHEAT|nr:hypothetical protein CFC21_104348 [Triticum aestivum]
MTCLKLARLLPYEDLSSNITAERNVICFIMLPRFLVLFLLFIIPVFKHYAIGEDGFRYGDGIPLGMLRLDGVASITSGALMLTNSDPQRSGRAFSRSSFGYITSFSTTFVFLVIPPDSKDGVSAHGLAFALSSTVEFVFDAHPGPYLGLTNMKSSGTGTNQLFAIELDTIKNPQFADIDDNHVGIDVNSMVSISSHTAGYYTSNGMFSPLKLASGQPMQVWVDYDGTSHNISVSLAPYLEHKPQRPLLSSTVNLTSVLANNSFYVGFSSSTGLLKSRHYIIGWSFNTTRKAQPLNYTSLSQVIEDVRPKPHTRSHIPRAILVPVVTISTVIVLVICGVLYALRKKARNNFEWEIEAGPPSFTYKELVSATKGFNDAMLLGEGGFGKVYKGVLQTSKQNVAIKRVSPESRQGMKEFISEIMILGHLRHRNLVQLLGYSRHRNELLLVYDYMPNGLGESCNTLRHQDKHARLGDFGLARLHNHENGTGAHVTNIAGTRGYIALELAMLGRATKATDVFAFGVFMLEVACGKHPIGVSYSGEQLLLKDCVRHAWERDAILTTVDPRLEDYITEEVELVLKLGLLCTHSVSNARPSMRLIMQYLGKDALLPDFQPSFPGRDEGFDQYISSSNSVATTMTYLSGGR